MVFMQSLAVMLPCQAGMSEHTGDKSGGAAAIRCGAMPTVEEVKLRTFWAARAAWV